MTWQNWPTYATQVLQWVMGLFPQIFEMMMENPIIGVPVLLGIVVIVFRLVSVFIGSIGANKGGSKEE